MFSVLECDDHSTHKRSAVRKLRILMSPNDEIGIQLRVDLPKPPVICSHCAQSDCIT